MTYDWKSLAANILQLLQQDPRRYRCFGSYWWLIKAVLRKFYTVENLSLLGEYVAPDAWEGMPEHADLNEALEAAIEEYRANASFGLGATRVIDEDAGPAS